MIPPKPKDSFYYNLYEIQKAAAELVKLQEKVKKSGVLSDDSQREYTENLEKLGISAQNLAHIQRESGLKDEFKLLFDETQSLINVDGKIQATLDRLDALAANKKPPNDDFDKVFEDSKIEEHFKGQYTTSKSYTTTTVRDAQIVNAPDEDASIAEAKPVGLAIAGKGGVASSRPQATAIVGDGGLAVANPVATAIAGLSLEQVDEIGIPIRKQDSPPTILPKVRTSVTERINLPLRGKYGLAESSIEQNIGLLVGPQYKSDARVSDSEIQSEIENKIALVNRNENNEETGFIEKDNTNPLKNIDPINRNQPNYPLAIAPEQIIPNQYPLIPPNYNSYLNFLRTHVNPEQYSQYSVGSPYDTIVPIDQALIRDRALPHTSNYDYDESVESDSSRPLHPFYHPHRQYPGYPVVFY